MKKRERDESRKNQRELISLFPSSYDPPMEGHRQACPAKFISDYRYRLNRLFFAGQRGGHPYYPSGSDFMEVLALNAILPSFPLSRPGFAPDYRFAAFGHGSNPLRQLTCSYARNSRFSRESDPIPPIELAGGVG